MMEEWSRTKPYSRDVEPQTGPRACQGELAMNQQNDQTNNTDTLNRRTILKMTGSAVVASGAMAGGASAHEINEAVFCGCSQVCACGFGKVDVIVAQETDDGLSCEWITIDDDATTDFSFCEEPGDGKVIAIKDGDGTVVCNPHEPCAGDALDDCGINCTRDGESGGPCGEAFLRTCDESDDHPGQGKGQGKGQGNGRHRRDR